MLSPGAESVVLPLQSREETCFLEQNLLFLLAEGEMNIEEVKNVGTSPYTSMVFSGK